MSHHYSGPDFGFPHGDARLDFTERMYGSVQDSVSRQRMKRFFRTEAAWPMSAMGHEQTSHHVHVMSVIPLKADIHQRGLHVRLVPIADIMGCSASSRLTSGGRTHHGCATSD
jgi:hypothetical protein